jgi:three-Cys-motif partner protein
MINRNRDFFEERSIRSEVKTEIVRKYFLAWAKIMVGQVKKKGGDKIGYVDLFAGRGRYNDGSPSTPLRILEGAIRDKDISQMLIAVFNDRDHDNAVSLKAEIGLLPNIKLLKYEPKVRNREIDDQLARILQRTATIPILYFLDPWGYKGLSLALLNAAIKSWGSDCIFFFNYNRINAALSNPVFTENMNSLFGAEGAHRLRRELHGKEPWQRQELIITELKRALARLGGRYSIEYCFKNDGGHKTSHFLIFTSKNVLGYNIMKQIMAGESSSNDHGVASFQFNPLDITDRPEQGTLFEPPNAVDDLASTLVKEYAGRKITVGEIYRKHNVGRRFILRNYQDAIKKLDADGRVRTNPPIDKRIRAHKVTLSETVEITFPQVEVA